MIHSISLSRAYNSAISLPRTLIIPSWRCSHCVHRPTRCLKTLVSSDHFVRRCIAHLIVSKSPVQLWTRPRGCRYSYKTNRPGIQYSRKRRVEQFLSIDRPYRLKFSPHGLAYGDRLEAAFVRVVILPQRSSGRAHLISSAARFRSTGSTRTSAASAARCRTSAYRQHDSSSHPQSF